MLQDYKIRGFLACRSPQLHWLAYQYITPEEIAEDSSDIKKYIDYGKLVTKMYLHLAQQFQLLHSDIYRLDPVFFRKYD